KLVGTAGGLSLRRSLIVFQFATSVVLIVGTLTVSQQLRYMQEQDLGIDIAQTLVIRAPGLTDSTYDARANSFKTDIVNARLAKRITASAYVPGQEIYWTNGARRMDLATQQPAILYNTAIDYAYVDAYGVKLVAGRNFSKDFSTDRKAVLLSETAAEMLDFNSPQDAINKELLNGRDTLRVVGVVKNYHQQGLRLAHWPMIFRLAPDAGRFYSLKVETARLPETLAALKAKYDQFFPDNPFEYFFLDEYFNQQYQAEQRFGRVFGLFAGFAVVIACLGLFGLASFTAGQRTKEIGIRKVLGASVPSIVALISKDFIKLLLIANVLAWPLAWWTMDTWLRDFAYRIHIGWWVFALAGGVALVIALLTVSFQAIKAAMANPVESLRTE
ncbi:MAG: ABC transporter permease, partial [Ferruginibacter sp.]|nr:ABC transporter permease [Cytophagales bacterium]